MAQLIFSIILRIFPIGGRLPIYQQSSNMTGFIILDSIIKKQNAYDLKFHLLGTDQVREIIKN